MNPPTWTQLLQIAGAVFGLWLFHWFFIAKEAKAQDIVWHGYLPPINIEWMVLSIKGAENWDKVKRPIGAAGERGEMQFTQARWKELSTKPHYWCGSRQNFAIKETHRVEIAHVLDIIGRFKGLNRRPTPFLVAAIHCAGYDAVASNHVPAMKKDFSERADNLYYDFEKAK